MRHIDGLAKKLLRFEVALPEARITSRSVNVNPLRLLTSRIFSSLTEDILVGSLVVVKTWPDQSTLTRKTVEYCLLVPHTSPGRNYAKNLI